MSTRPLDTSLWLKRAGLLAQAHADKQNNRPPNTPPASEDAMQVLWSTEEESPEEAWHGCDVEQVLAGTWTKGSGFYRFTLADPPITLTTHYLARGDRPEPTRGAEGTDGARRYYESALASARAKERDLELKIESVEGKLALRDVTIADQNRTITQRDARIAALESKTTEEPIPWYAGIAMQAVDTLQEGAALIKTHATTNERSTRYEKAQSLLCDLTAAIIATGRPGQAVARDPNVRTVLEELEVVLDLENWLKDHPPPEPEPEAAAPPAAPPPAPPPPPPPAPPPPAAPPTHGGRRAAPDAPPPIPDAEIVEEAVELDDNATDEAPDAEPVRKWVEIPSDERLPLSELLAARARKKREDAAAAATTTTNDTKAP